MSKKQDLPRKLIQVDHESLYEILSFYKFPLGLFLLGLACLVLAVVFYVKDSSEETGVVFQLNSASSSATKNVTVDIQGEVILPGVYEFHDNDRIAQALEKCGGFTLEADREWVAKNINRASKLIDGGKIYIPAKGETISKTNASLDQNVLSGRDNSALGLTIGKININTASSHELEDLSGIGPVTAEKIISNRPYEKIEDLRIKKVVGESVFEKIKDSVVVY